MASRRKAAKAKPKARTRKGAKRAAAKRAKPYTLIQLSDTHLFANPEERQSGWCTQSSFMAVLDAIRARKPDALLVTGDLVHDESPAGYSRMASALHKMQIPVCYLPGNHDDPHQLQTAFAPLGVSAPTRILLGGWQILLLDDHQPGTDAGYIAQDQLDQLAYWLVHHHEPALIAVHHPPVPVGSRWLDELGLRNGPTLLKLAALHAQVRAIVCGHVHQAVDMTAHGLRVLAVPSTCRQFLPRSHSPTLDPDAEPGFRSLRLFPGGRLETEVIRVAAARAAGFQSIPQEGPVSYCPQ